MRILIADDEPLVRYGLISILEDIQGERQTVVEAENGLELIEKAREIRPHIAFVDIRMPKKDGLEAVSEAREYSPETLWVMITGHADFAYAQKAVKLGVEDFLLKPADPDELKILMKKLSAKMRERRHRGNRELEAKAAAVLGDTTSIRYDAFFAEKRIWQACMVIWDSLLPHEEILRRRRDFAGRIIGELDTYDDSSGSVVSMKDGSLLIILATTLGNQSAVGIPRLWRRRFDELRAITGNLTGEGIGDTWLLTRAVKEPEELFREIEILDEESILRFLLGAGRITEYDEMVRHAGSERFLKAANLLQDLRDAYTLGQEAEFHVLSHRLEEAVRNFPDNEPIQDGPAWFARFAVPLPPPMPADFGDLTRRIREEGHNLFSDAAINTANRDAGETPHTLVERAMKILERFYRDNIGIGQVAERLGVTPNYLSTVFKKETGMNFTRRLTELRLEKSKELLRRGEANVGEVARSLGYQSGRHFTRLFKDRYGRTPSEWMAEPEE